MVFVVREIAHGSSEYSSSVQLRCRVLREPLGLQFDVSAFVAEGSDIHIAAFADPDPGSQAQALIGILILTPDAQPSSTGIKMRQVAVASDCQRMGVGTETYAAANGYTRIHMHARVTAVAFYEVLGYSAVGDVSTEVSIPHIQMHKQLRGIT